MRKYNSIISMIIIGLFLIHAVTGVFKLTGMISGGSDILTVMSRVMLVLIIVHIIFGVKLFIDTILAKHRAGVWYPKENKLFLVRRISGLSVFVFMICHVLIFIGNSEDGAYRLNYFGKVQLVTQILLVISIALHVISNVKPVLIAFGIKSLKEYAVDILIVLSILFLLMGIAFCVYYVRWTIF